MPSPAQVRSVASIETFRNALIRFQERAQGALENLSGELHRSSDWLQYDRPAYWKVQLRLAENELQQAQIDLERCLIFPIAGERPTCRKERAVLKKIQVRVDYCREKQQRVRHWQREFQHEQLEYEGRVGQFRRLLETELPLAKNKLEQILRRLDEYRVELPPSPDNPLHEGLAEESSAESMHRTTAKALPESDSSEPPISSEN